MIPSKRDTNKYSINYILTIPSKCRSAQEHIPGGIIDNKVCLTSTGRIDSNIHRNKVGTSRIPVIYSIDPVYPLHLNSFINPNNFGAIFCVIRSAAHLVSTAYKERSMRIRMLKSCRIYIFLLY